MASSPVRCASAPAAKAATSWCRTCTHSILPWSRIASVSPFRLSPTMLCSEGGIAPPPEAQSQIGRGRLSETETQSDRGIDVAVLEEAEAQPAMHLVEHHAKIEIPLWRKSPIHRGRNRIVRPGALRVLAAGAEEEPSSGGAEPGILDVMVIGADHIQMIRDGIFRAGPHDL